MTKKKTESVTRLVVPPPLNDAYHKARRNYGLFSGLLIAWELIGVELDKVPFNNLNIVLKSPHAVPYVLIVLVLYFAFRISVEWHQSDPQRRKMKASILDFFIAHGIAIAAVGLYYIQRELDLQVANVADRPVHMLGMNFFIIGVLIVLFIWSLPKYLSRWDIFESFLTMMMLLLLLFLFFMRAAGILRATLKFNESDYLILILYGFAGALLTLLMASRRAHELMHRIDAWLVQHTRPISLFNRNARQ